MHAHTQLGSVGPRPLSGNVLAPQNRKKNDFNQEPCRFLQSCGATRATLYRALTAWLVVHYNWVLKKKADSGMVLESVQPPLSNHILFHGSQHNIAPHSGALGSWCVRAHTDTHRVPPSIQTRELITGVHWTVGAHILTKYVPAALTPVKRGQASAGLYIPTPFSHTLAHQMGCHPA
jgi:hypothetical protein